LPFIAIGIVLLLEETGILGNAALKKTLKKNVIQPMS
jgi:hypothetical protein